MYLRLVCLVASAKGYPGLSLRTVRTASIEHRHAKRAIVNQFMASFLEKSIFVLAEDTIN